MKCIDSKSLKRRNRERQLAIRMTCSFLVILTCIVICVIYLNSQSRVRKYEQLSYSTSVYQANLFADDLCVANEDVEFKDFYRNDKFPGALLFDIDSQEVIYSENVHEKVYPASTTKIMTAYLALKYGSLEDEVTISEHAVDVPSDSSTAHLSEGDVLSLKDLLYGLMLPSGNDSAVAIAEHISGSEEEFVKLMNEEAKLLGASHTHFVNPHGYHDDEHYTTAYDLYLIFQECIQNQTFLQIISSSSYTTTIAQNDGTFRDVTWGQSNYFVNGAREVPEEITVIGGKTGNTYDAGSCILLYCHDSENTPYIAIMMGATSRRNLYDNMTFLLAAIE